MGLSGIDVIICSTTGPDVETDRGFTALLFD